MTEHTISSENQIAAVTLNTAWDAFDADSTQRTKKASAGQMAAYAGMPYEAVTALNTAGAGTITAAGIVGQVTSRGGTQSANFIDTTDQASNIISTLPAWVPLNYSWRYIYQNNTNQNATISAGLGVTITGGSQIVPSNCWCEFVATVTGSSAVTFNAVEMGINATLPATSFVSTATTGNFTTAMTSGASFCVLATSGTTAANTPTGTQWFNNLPNAQIGMSWILRIFNTNAGTLTLTGVGNVTINGTNTIATNVWRDYFITLTATNAATMQNIGAGDAT